MWKYLCLLTVCIINFSLCSAWDGYDWKTGENIDIDRGNLVRSGRDIEVYHWDSGEYRDEEVTDITGDELETYDYNTGEYHTYDMD